MISFGVLSRWSYNCLVKIFLTISSVSNTQSRYVSSNLFFIFFPPLIFLSYRIISYFFFDYWILNPIFWLLDLHKTFGWLLFRLINLQKEDVLKHSLNNRYSKQQLCRKTYFKMRLLFKIVVAYKNVISKRDCVQIKLFSKKKFNLLLSQNFQQTMLFFKKKSGNEKKRIIIFVSFQAVL